MRIFIYLRITGSKTIEPSPRRILLTASSSGSGSSSHIIRSRPRLTEEVQHDISPVATSRSFLIDTENSDSTDVDGNNDDDDTYHDATPFEQLNEEDAVICRFSK